ncbi:NAD(P)-dependent dehydrogenase (short-subunit alcohol dehydrogenase family) [Novosphingobium chloroacetimidivorans]|uniref:NAD(P)-dependent dehydrogenase (Short-subunit alcohol dehydrogenase family) n=1 Tax=Novosphingobium chloroacetimidivorans TaxID=1428314 RepID=A0A7W7KBM8_9SPHN|nr:NAD(P)-dependent dehydrogenase (short-subunit alcohol dehydrogenase family) [Novosphingobium chloroacetimidivorans]
MTDQTGKCFVVTGANTGLGLEISKTLAMHGARVVLACRNEAKATAAMAVIRNLVPQANLGFAKLDQGDLDSVAACAEQLQAEDRIDALINNAGVMMPPLERTAQGHEPQFGINHLGCFALSCRLLPKLAQAPRGRVVVTSSLAHHGGKIEWDDLDAHQSYTDRRYSDSKLMNLLFALELGRRLRAAGSPVIAVACHPGVAATDLGRNLGAFGRLIWPLAGTLFNSAEQGAAPTLQAATQPDVKPGGYYGPQQIFGMRGSSGLAKIGKVALDREAARRLWNVSVEMTGVDPRLPDAA